MSDSHRLLVAAEEPALFQWLQAESAREAFAGRPARPEPCEPDAIDARLRDAEVDGLIVRERAFTPDLAAAVRRWKSLRPSVEVLLLIDRLPDTRQIVDLMRSGAYDVLDLAPGPDLREAIGALVRRLDESRLGDLERKQARQSLAGLGLIGESSEMQNLAVEILNAAGLTCPVLVTGPPGAGKTLAVHAIHALSARAARPLLTIDCAALPPALIESLINRESARRAALVLRSVHEAPASTQADLLRLLDQASGEDDPLRVFATAPRRLDEFVRADLAYRLGVLTIDVPALRRRAADIPQLARDFLARHSRLVELSEAAAAALTRYEWPGNVRELKQAIGHAAARCAGNVIEESHLPAAVLGEAPAPEALSVRELDLARLEEQAILRALHVTGFDKSKAARLLGIGKTTMYRKLKALSERARRAG